MDRDPITAIYDFVKFMDDTCAAYEYSLNRLDELNGYIQDLLHDAELGDEKDQDQAAMFYWSMREARQERRKCKNEIEMLKPLVEWIQGSQSYRGKLTHVQGVLNATAKRQKNRQYTPRTD